MNEKHKDRKQVIEDLLRCIRDARSATASAKGRLAIPPRKLKPHLHYFTPHYLGDVDMFLTMAERDVERIAEEQSR
jgi:hypothetical protein